MSLDHYLRDFNVNFHQRNIIIYVMLDIQV